jgi:dTDP-L-rhamnose 4-epimerase
MKILVTGGAGFIGSWLVEKLLAQGDSVTVIDNLSPQIHGPVPAPQLAWLSHPELRFERADIRNAEALDRLLTDIEAVVHLAAETGTGQSMYQIRHYYEVNVQATATLLELIGTKHKQVKKIVLASSRSIYGEGAYQLNGNLVVPAPRTTDQLSAGNWEPVGSQGEAITLIATPEYAPPKPASVYAATKLANEQLGQVFADAYNTRVVALRFQNVYGERQSLRNPYTGILSIFSNRMRQNLPINIFEDGLESRDFVHVSDVVQSICLALDSKQPGFNAINIGAGEATSVLALATQLRHLLGSTSALSISGDFRAGDIRHCYANIERAKTALGFAPQVSLDVGLQKFVAWVCTQTVIEDRSAQAQSELTRLGLGRTAA